VDSYVGPYRIIRLIDRGGQGSVYLGYDKRLHRRVAIKIYTLPRDRAARKHTRREAQLVAALDSPKIVKIHDVIESSEHLAMVMEYIPGCTLEDLLRSVRLSLSSVLSIGIDVAGALAIARQQHVIHGDLKAGNVLITSEGRAKLTDFGIASKTRGQASKIQASGSESAMTPEQLSAGEIDQNADLFALGILLYRMLSGQHPFMSSGKLDTHQLLHGEPLALPQLVAADRDLPDSMVQLVSTLLEKEPSKRPRHTRGIRQVLRNARRDIPMSSRNNLLAEAQAHFRSESPEDMPPAIPSDLGRDARSGLPPQGRFA